VQMSVSTKHVPSWPGATALRSTIVFAGFALFGLLLTIGFSQLFTRFGIAATAAMVVAVPFAFVVGVGAIPGLASGLRSLGRSFGWRESLWALLFISAMTFEVRNVHETMNVPMESNKWLALRLGSEVVIVLVLAWRVASGKNSLRYLFAGLPAFVSLYCLVSLVSMAWSIVPLFTLFKVAEYSLDVVACAFLIESTNAPADLLNVLNWTFVLYALETANAWVGAVISPATAWDDMGRLYGFYPMVGANGIGTTGAVLTLVGISRLLWRDRRGSSRAWYWALIVYGVASMVASRTRHSFASFAVGLLVVLILAKRKWIGLVLVGATTPLLVFTPIGSIVVEYMRRGQSDEDIRGLTSRVDFWQYAWQQLAQHPLTGLGAYAGGRFGVLEKLGHVDAAALHSDWAEIMTGTSFWGVLAMLLAVVGTGWFLYKGTSSRRLSPLERDLSVECSGVMATLTLHSFFNNEFTWHSPLYFLALLGYAELVRRKLRAKEGAAPSPVVVGATLKPIHPF